MSTREMLLPCGELGRDENIVFCSGDNARATVYRNIQKSALCRVIGYIVTFPGKLQYS